MWVIAVDDEHGSRVRRAPRRAPPTAPGRGLFFQAFGMTPLEIAPGAMPNGPFLKHFQLHHRIRSISIATAGALPNTPWSETATCLC
jgi:hypothetical protein